MKLFFFIIKQVMKGPVLSGKLDMIMELTPSPERMSYVDEKKRMHLGSLVVDKNAELAKQEMALDTNHTEEEISSREEAREKTVKQIIELRLKMKDPLNAYNSRLKSSIPSSIQSALIQNFSTLIKLITRSKALMSKTRCDSFSILMRINQPKVSKQ
jgi:hypothetical protein